MARRCSGNKLEGSLCRTCCSLPRTKHMLRTEGQKRQAEALILCLCARGTNEYLRGCWNTTWEKPNLGIPNQRSLEFGVTKSKKLTPGLS
jgi:hypothetical protein